MNKKMALLLAEYSFNKSNLARDLDVTPQAVALAYSQGYFSNAMAIKIEKLTKGNFKAVDLCKPSH